MSVAGALLGRARKAGFDYRCFRVMRLALDRASPVPALPDGLRLAEVDERTVAESGDEEIRESAWYGGRDASGYALLRTSRIVCLQWLWFGERLRRAGFWRFADGDAVSMHLVTVPDERGRGYATLIKRLTAGRMRERGFGALYSRIWWTNAPSLRVSEKAGWHRAGTTLSVVTPWRDAPFEWRFARRGRPVAPGGGA